MLVFVLVVLVLGLVFVLGFPWGGLRNCQYSFTKREPNSQLVFEGRLGKLLVYSIMKIL